MKRGGLCYVGSKRYVKAKNNDLDVYGKSKPSNHWMYWDANNLYGGAMSEFLPCDGLRKNDDITLEDVLATDDYAEEGHGVRVDSYFPPEIHERLKEFPPAPENVVPKVEWFFRILKGLG